MSRLISMSSIIACVVIIINLVIPHFENHFMSNQNQRSRAEDELLQIEEEIFSAIKSKEAKRLDKLLADDGDSYHRALAENGFGQLYFETPHLIIRSIARHDPGDEKKGEQDERRFFQQRNRSGVLNS